MADEPSAAELWAWRPMSRTPEGVMGDCPHADTEFCPLYHATHGGDWPWKYGCDDGRLNEGGCAVSRGMDYTESAGQLLARMPREMANLKFREQESQLRAQRARNMRVAGIH